MQEADARAQVLQLLDALGIDNMGIAYVEKARIIQANPPYEIYSVGYQYVLTRNDGGGMAIDLEGRDYLGLVDFTWDSLAAFSERWDMERMTVYVDETGICELEWQYPLSVAEALNENVSLLPFEEMQEKIRQAIKVGYRHAYDWLPEGANLTLHIEKIVLSHLLVPAKDQPGYQLFAPAWLIFYSYEHDDGWWREEDCMFALNAIDGSIIYTTNQIYAD